MRRLTIVMLTLATALVIAVPASAKKDNPGPPDPEPLAGTTCVSPWWEGDIKDGDGDGWSDDFEIVLNAEQQNACIDIMTDTAGTWNITVEVTGGDGARTMTIIPRDAVAPGDSCGGEGRRGSSIYDPWVLPHPDDLRFDVIPASTVNACTDDDQAGIGYFAETVERLSSDGFIETEIVSIPTNEIHPLAFLVFTQGLRGDDEVTLFVDLPDAGL